MVGSSPLARGLLITPAWLPVGAGIIPARAGFTGHFDPVPHHLGDHPRSRGVYARAAPTGRAAWGSSPLARGLPVPKGTGSPYHRIIPARAGFAAAPGPRPPRSGDHPRSRGVYRPPATRTRGDHGSSPLARGLPPRRHTMSTTERIIPARAGFTAALADTVSGIRGSSPLARGLRPQSQSGHTSLRIIPARAGFTTGPETRSSCVRDHPRSRGVYRALSTGPGRCSRIIPARAGFTRAFSASPWAPEDHPRSRGVYRLNLSAPGGELGSSPLARGLLT